MKTPNNENLENVEDPFGFVRAINFDVIDNLEGEELAQVIDIVSRIKQLAAVDQATRKKQ